MRVGDLPYSPCIKRRCRPVMRTTITGRRQLDDDRRSLEGLEGTSGALLPRS